MDKQYTKYFVSKQRPDESYFVSLSDDSPEELKELVHHIHDDIFNAYPNDWIYSTISEALEDLSESSLDDITIEGDVYTKDLLKWYTETPSADYFCVEAVDLGLTSSQRIDELIGWGQYLSKKAIYESVNDFLEKQQNEEE